jgi:Fic family protein
MSAHKELASLDGTGKHLPNPALVMRPLQRREAQKSSNLEGTYTEPQEQAFFELDPTEPQSPEDPANARREVANYAAALRYGRERKEELPISLRFIRELHEILMKGVRGSDKNPGEFRKLQNQINRPARYVPPPPQLLMPQLDALEKYLQGERQLDPLVEVFLVHYQFEAIHPFMDGNGRVGRLLLAVLIEEWCELSGQWLYMSAYFERNRDTYIDLLLAVSTRGAWSDWIRFCLAGVVEAAVDAKLRCEQLVQLHRDFHERLRLGKGSTRLSAMTDDLFKTPVAIPARIAKTYGVSYPTARADLNRLQAAGIVEQIKNPGPIAYICPPILEITYRD